MKKKMLLTLCLFSIIFVASCDEMETAQQGPTESEVNNRLIHAYNNMAIEAAVISQHTLYPYHFIQNSKELNDLGFRDFGVLAGHFLENPGTLNIRHDQSVSDDLYGRRVEYISDMLEESGVDSDRIAIEDGMPGGSGVTSERLLFIAEKVKESMSTGDSSNRQGMSTQSSSSRR
ncbi:MAG: rhodanese-like domain-containing protein [Planctomycetota bacterium]|jgi:hypothetical protein